MTAKRRGPTPHDPVGSARNLNQLWAGLLIEEFVRHGVRHAFLAPGSRSTPLALAAASHPQIDLAVHFDERGIGFAALGCARATGGPALVITTSGTAVANLLPAIVEASLEQIPMLVLTGDRPPELRDNAANQSIDQVKLFGAYVRWFADLPCPTAEISPRYVLTTAATAIQHAASGPVHLNCQFREPLAPVPQEFDRARIAADLGTWPARTTPWTQVAASATAQSLSPLVDDLAAAPARRGLLVAAGGLSPADTTQIRRLGEHFRWPILADLRSGLRGTEVISFADHALLAKSFADGQKPDVVLQFGARLVSKRIQQWIDAAAPRVYGVIHSGTARIDPGHTVTHRWNGNPGVAATMLRAVLRPCPAAWSARWRAADRTVATVLARELPRHGLSEPWIARSVSRLLPARHALVAASSMPVRDLETFAAFRRPTRVVANRGASGIDGTVATAAGVARGGGRPVTLLIGDLSLLHDLNSLALLKDARHPVVIVAINNDGGGIFSFLPVAAHPDHFERCFGTPHGLAFEAAADQFGLTYIHPETQAEFVAAYRAAAAGKGSTLIEVRTRRDENLAVHRAVQAAVVDALERAQ